MRLFHMVFILVLLSIQLSGASSAQSCTDKQADDMWEFIGTISPLVEGIVTEFEKDSSKADYMGILRQSLTQSSVMILWNGLDTCETHDEIYDRFQEFYDISALRASLFLIMDEDMLDLWTNSNLFKPFNDRYELATIGVNTYISVQQSFDN